MNTNVVLHIISYSNVEIKPIPKEYRSTKKKRKFNVAKARKNIMKSTDIKHKDKASILALAMIMNGAENSYLDEDYKESDDIDITEIKISEKSHKWYDKQMNKKKAIYVDWKKNIVYYKTKHTQSSGAMGSYGEMGKFACYIQKITDKIFYFPCDALIDQTTCERYKMLMEKAWHDWIKKYTNLKEVGDLECVYRTLHYDEKEDDNINLDRYIKIYKSLILGAECGILICC